MRELDCARRLIALGAHKGAAQVLFNAALQREARGRTRWTPSGPLPFPANDPVPSSMDPTVA